MRAVLPASPFPIQERLAPAPHRTACAGSTMQLDHNGYYELPARKLAALVTYLEVTAPPRVPALPAPAGLDLRRVVRPDPDWYRELFRQVGAEWLWFSRLALGDPELTAIIRDPRVQVYGLTRDGRDQGLLELDQRAWPDVELAFLGLTRDAIGRGAGRWLIARALALAWAPGPRRVWVHTCTFDHPRALSLYLRAGFRPYRRAVEVADDPRLLGLLPRDCAAWLPPLSGEVG
jgi:GNAT superfamily N-acetyltransferase